MARAAFLMEKGGAGLHGRAFIPLLSSFACAIPGSMATRVIFSRRGRLATILVAPPMTCSARIPVYTLSVVRRETNSWKWTAFLFSSMLALAYLAAFATYHMAGALGAE